MKNICFDHYRPTMSEFTVTESRPGYAKIKINDEFIYRIDGNMLWWCGDDIINLHGTHLKIINVNRNNNTILVRYSHPESWGFEDYAAGDKIEYVRGNTLLPYGEATVLSAEKINPTDVLIKVDTFPDTKPAENDVIRYEPVVMDKSSATPVHKKLILRYNRFISGTGRKYTVNLSYLGEAVIEGNTSDVELVITKKP